MRKLLWLVPGALVAVLLTGCSPNVTQSRVDGAVGPAFADLYQLQQSLLGQPTVVDPQGSAQCQRTGRGVPNSGAGDDWLCQVSLSINGQFQAVFPYDLSVKSDGCFTADGSPTLVGGAMLTTPGGAAKVNPLFAFDGCFDT